MLKWLGLFDQVKERACLLDYLDLVRYEDGSQILRRSAQDTEQRYGAPWM